MGRPRGRRNADYGHERAALLARVQARLGAPDGARASFRELAAAAEVSVPTLRHYFGSREGLLEALLEASHQQGLPYLQLVAAGPLGPFADSIRNVVYAVAMGLQSGVLDIHTLGLSTGLRDPDVGPAYINEILEPTLQSVEARLQRHIAAGDMRTADTRLAAIQLISPLLVAFLHQKALGGDRCRPLDLPSILDAHVEAFLRAWRP